MTSVDSLASSASLASLSSLGGSEDGLTYSHSCDNLSRRSTSLASTTGGLAAMTKQQRARGQANPANGYLDLNLSTAIRDGGWRAAHLQGRELFSPLYCLFPCSETATGSARAGYDERASDAEWQRWQRL